MNLNQKGRDLKAVSMYVCVCVCLMRDIHWCLMAHHDKVSLINVTRITIIDVMVHYNWCTQSLMLFVTGDCHCHSSLMQYNIYFLRTGVRYWILIWCVIYTPGSPLAGISLAKSVVTLYCSVTYLGLVIFTPQTPPPSRQEGYSLCSLSVYPSVWTAVFFFLQRPLPSNFINQWCYMWIFVLHKIFVHLTFHLHFMTLTVAMLDIP